MSRIGNSLIKLPDGVNVVYSREDAHVVCIQGPKGILSQYVNPVVQVVVQEDGYVKLICSSDEKSDKALHGLYRALLNNLVVGVSVGFKKTLELVGVGYKANVQDNVLELSLGYSHDIIFILPSEVSAVAELVKGKDPLIHLESIDNQLIGQVAAKIRALRKVEPYKGKGVRFLGESIRRKVGKSTAK